MKKSMVALLLSGIISGAAFAQSVSSANIVGYVKVELEPQGKFHMLAYNFESGESSPKTLQDILGTNQLRQSDFLIECDKVVIWETDTQRYQRWAQWTDGNFYKANNASEWSQSIIGNPSVPQGSAFWVVSAGTSETNSIVFSGDVVLAETNSIEIIEGFQMISYPFSSDAALKDLRFLQSGASASDFLVACDKISVWEGDRYQRYALWTDGKWYKADNAAQWNESIEADINISLGSGVFYIGVEPFTWIEQKPYQVE